MKRVLCISPHYPPDATAGAHRMRLLAPHLAAAGWQPTVLTVAASSYEGRLDATLLPSKGASVDVVRVGAVPAVYSRFVGFGDLGLRALPSLYAEATRLCRKARFDAVYITTYPIYPAVLGPWLRRRFGLPFCLDLQDPWVGSWGATVGPSNGTPDLRSRMSRALALRLERAVLLQADALTAVSQMTIDQAFARHGRRPPRETLELPIGWDAADWDDVATPSEFFVPTDGAINLCYVGTLLPAGLTVASAFLRAMRNVAARHGETRGRVRLHFVGTSNQNHDRAPARVGVLARSEGIPEMCHEHASRVPFRTAVGLNRHASAVIVLGSTEPHYTASKLYPALAARRPIFALMHEASPAAAILRDVLRHKGGSVVTFRDERDLEARHEAIVEGIERTIRAIEANEQPESQRWLEAHSARTLSRHLAQLLERTRTTRFGSAVTEPAGAEAS